MKAKRYLWLFIASLTIFYLINSYHVPFSRANGQIPQDYHQNLNLNGTFVYNVTDFGTDPLWWWIFENRNYTETNPGGQIVINFTGFYPRHPFDPGDVFPDEMPYMNIDIYNNTGSGLILNFTQNNISNKEISWALALGFNDFQSGFLIPTNNLTEVKQFAIQEADPDGMFDRPGDVVVETTHNFFHVGFNSDDKALNVSLVYEKNTGILVRANTTIGGYKLGMFLTNFSLDFNQTYIYDVEEFGDPSTWWWGVAKGNWETSPNGKIIINFTGHFPRDPNDIFPDVFPNNISYMNISIYNHTGISLIQNFTQVNISNKEVAFSMNIGYNNFQSGFLVPLIDNLTLVRELALQEASGGTVNLYESGATLKITFDADSGATKTYLIYEKWTGLLLWANSTAGGYHNIFKMQNYSLWYYEDVPPTEPPEDLDPLIDRPDGSDDLIYLIGLINIISIGAIGFSILSVKSDKIHAKHGLIGTIGVACFASLIFFSNGIFPFLREIPEQPNENAENITLIIDYGDGRIDTWENFSLFEGNTTVLDALNKYCDIEVEDYGIMGFLVTEINGYKNGAKSWRYGVNSERVGYSAAEYNLEDGDVINWIYGDSYQPP
jgi:hypothetical protein